MTVLGVLRLLAPALIPSWNFFDVIADSPRVEYARLPAPDAETEAWREFRPRPQRVSPATMAGRLLWNARWNESLFVTSCAERLLAAPGAHSEDEIFHRIAADLADGADAGDGWLSFRIVLLSQQPDAIDREIAFVAPPRRLSDIPVR
jgi:hypothetical protein